MSMKKIMACTAASVVAASTMAAAAFAGEINFGYVSGWVSTDWGTKDDIVANLFEGNDPSTVESITFTATGADEWGIGYQGVDGWWQTDSNSDEQSWWDSSKEFTLPADQIDIEADNAFFKVCANLSHEEEDLVVTWTLNMKDGSSTTGEATVDAGSGDAATGDTANSDTGVEGVAAVLGVAAVAAGAMIVAKKRK